MNPTASLPAKRVFIQEVVARDGFQIEDHFVPTARKIALIDELSRTGLAKIEVTSFTSPKAIPMLADAEAVMDGIRRNPEVAYTVLVPNVRGAERALLTRPDEFNLVMSCSESHNLSNLRMTCGQSRSTLDEVIRIARDAKVASTVSLSCSFGCPMEGDVPERTVFDLAAHFIDEGANAVALCDTTGMAFPSQVARMVREFISRWPGTQLTLHFHNTRGMGLANAMAAVQAGADRFDSSLGGVGGCPYAPGASGNVCTEDLVHMLDLSGCRTGVDFAALLACARSLSGLLGHDVPGQVAKAGHRLTPHPPREDLEAIRSRALAKPR